MIEPLIYGLTAIALLTAAWAARGIWRELADDLRHDLQYAARRFRGLRIVIRRGGRLAPPCEGQAHNLAPIHGDDVRLVTSAPPSSTTGHRLRLVTPNSQPPPITVTKGDRHG